MKITSFHHSKLKMLLILLSVTAMTGALLYVLCHYDNKYSKKAELRQDGVTLVPENGIRFLTDGWEFYPDRLLSPQDFLNGNAPGKRYRITLGDYPNLSPFHEDNNPYGVSTWRLRISGNGMYSLYLQEPLCAVTVFINGKALATNGNVDPDGYRPQIRDIVCAFLVDGETELIVQTANYSHYYGGLYYPPAVGGAGDISRMVISRIIFYGLLCFSSMAVALFSIAVWAGSKGHRDPASFYFGLLAFSFALRVCYPFLRFWGAPFVRSLYALEDTAAMLGLYCVVRISLLFFAPGMKHRLRTAVLAVTLGMCAVAAVVPLLILPVLPGFTPSYGILVSWYKLLAALFLMGTALYGVHMERPHAGPALAAVTAYAICLFSTTFLINQFEPVCTGWPDEYGAYVMVLLFGGIMVRRSRKMAAEHLRLTTHLQEEVAEKTQHLSLLLQERSKLVEELGHDMKSPVTALSNIVQILRLGSPLSDEDAHEKIRMMEERCNDLANRLGLIQRVASETGGLSEMHIISLNHFLLEFHRSLQPVVEMTGPDFVCKLPHRSCFVLADPNKLSRALENLVFNAAEFTPPEGRIEMTLECENNHACIQIADNGCGIDTENIGRIFDRFYTTRAEKGGHGLGLAITKSILTEHCGEIHAASEPGRGTVFTIHLPLAEPDNMDRPGKSVTME